MFSQQIQEINTQPTSLQKRNGDHHHKRANKDNFFFIMVKSANFRYEHQLLRNKAPKAVQTVAALEVYQQEAKASCKELATLVIERDIFSEECILKQCKPCC